MRNNVPQNTGVYRFVKNRVMRDLLRIKENCDLQFFLNADMSCEIRDGMDLSRNRSLQDACSWNCPACFGIYVRFEVLSYTGCYGVCQKLYETVCLHRNMRCLTAFVKSFILRDTVILHLNWNLRDV